MSSPARNRVRTCHAIALFPPFMAFWICGIRILMIEFCGRREEGDTHKEVGRIYGQYPSKTTVIGFRIVTLLR
jgi:hypothetical protein